MDILEPLTRFQKYWIDLKVQNPEAYQRKLKRNRERARDYRKMIRNDPEKRAKHNAKRRERYRQKVNAFESSSTNGV